MYVTSRSAIEMLGLDPLAIQEGKCVYRRPRTGNRASGRILCESPLMEEDAVLMQKTYRRLAKAAQSD